MMGFNYTPINDSVGEWNTFFSFYNNIFLINFISFIF